MVCLVHSGASRIRTAHGAAANNAPPSRSMSPHPVAVFVADTSRPTGQLLRLVRKGYRRTAKSRRARASPTREVKYGRPPPVTRCPAPASRSKNRPHSSPRSRAATPLAPLRGAPAVDPETNSSLLTRRPSRFGAALVHPKAHHRPLSVFGAGLGHPKGRRRPADRGSVSPHFGFRIWDFELPPDRRPPLLEFRVCLRHPKAHSH